MEAPSTTAALASLWRTCVCQFLTNHIVLHPNTKLELLAVQLEVELVRLLLWGDAVGLMGDNGGDCAVVDSRLEESVEMRTAAASLLAGVHQAIRDAEALYGLPPAAAAPNDGLVLRNLMSDIATEKLRELLLWTPPWTAEACRSAWTGESDDNDAGLRALSGRVRGFVDRLGALIPDAGAKVEQALKTAAASGTDRREVQLLHNAIDWAPGGLKDVAFGRLEELSSADSAETGGGRLGITADERGSKSVEEEKEVVEEPRRADGRTNELASDNEYDFDIAELAAKRYLQAHLAERDWGTLSVYLLGPIDVWLRVAARVSWSVSEKDDWPQQAVAEAKGFVRPSHASLGMSSPCTEWSGAT